MRLRTILTPVAGVAAALALASPASAAPITTITHEKNLVENFVDVVPTCEGGEAYDITTTSNSVDKLTTDPDKGTVRATFTQTGTVSAVPLDGTGPNYTGHFTIWGGFNQNTNAATSTFTFSVSLKGSDGSRVSTQQVSHFNERPDGTVHEFFKCQ